MPITQQTLTPLVEYKVFRGMDNLTLDSMRLVPGYVRIANNVDIDNEAMLHRRDGILESIFSGSWHSLWSKDDLCFGIKGGVLTKINLDWTETTVLSGVSTSRMNYVPVDDRTFISNGPNLIGYIKDRIYSSFPEPDRELRQKMVGGELIEYYNTRLYTVRDKDAYFSIAGLPMEMDEEKNHISFEGTMTMFHAVDDGIYVSQGNTISFLHGPDLPNMKYRDLLDVPAIKGSPVVVKKIDAGGGQVKCVIFSTKIGIFKGFPGGVLKNVTDNHYGVLDIEQGNAAIRTIGGLDQYIFMAQPPAESSGYSGSLTLPAMTGWGKSS